MFNDTAKVTKSHISTVNTPSRIIVLKEQHEKMKQFGLCLKCGRSAGSKDIVPRKRNGRNHEYTPLELPSPREVQTLDKVRTHEKINELGNTKISILIYESE